MSMREKLDNNGEFSHDEFQFSRGFGIASLALAILLVIGVLVGSKVFLNRVAFQPVAMTPLPSPLADSPECAQLIDALPATLAGHRRAELTEPAPPGAAAWQNARSERITLRCGVDETTQFNELTSTISAAGATWIRIDDMTPGSSMSTWYTVNTTPVVAVTADDVAADPVTGLDLSGLEQHEKQPAPIPLSDLAEGAENERQGCEEFMKALPNSLAEGYARYRVDAARTAAWVAEGREPIIVRCGVAAPANYRAGAQLYQINDVTWFEDTTLANGTTASTWYALGRQAQVAASLPHAEGNEAVTSLGEIIQATLPARQES